MKNHSFEQRQLLRKIRKNKIERRHNRIKIVGMFLLVGLLFSSGLYIKGNVPRECAIHSIDKNVLTVRHPKNNNLYKLEVSDPQNYKEDTMITVVFDEITTDNRWMAIKIKEDK